MQANMALEIRLCAAHFLLRLWIFTGYLIGWCLWMNVSVIWQWLYYNGLYLHINEVLCIRGNSQISYLPLTFAELDKKLRKIYWDFMTKKFIRHQFHSFLPKTTMGQIIIFGKCISKLFCNSCQLLRTNASTKQPLLLTPTIQEHANSI